MSRTLRRCEVASAGRLEGRRVIRGLGAAAGLADAEGVRAACEGEAGSRPGRVGSPSSSGSGARVAVPSTAVDVPDARGAPNMTNAPIIKVDVRKYDSQLAAKVTSTICFSTLARVTDSSLSHVRICRLDE